MLTDFNELQLDCASRLAGDPYWAEIVNYLVHEVTKLSLDAVRVSGDEKTKLSGACLAIEEFRDLLLLAPDVIKQRKDREEMSLMTRDPISP